MDLSPSAQRGLAETGRRSRVEDLLRRYPDVDAGETAEIIRFLEKGPPLEVALMTTVDDVKVKLCRFRADHAKHFALGPGHYLAVAAIVIALLARLTLLWDSGLGA